MNKYIIIQNNLYLFKKINSINCEEKCAFHCICKRTKELKIKVKNKITKTEKLLKDFQVCGLVMEYKIEHISSDKKEIFEAIFTKQAVELDLLMNIDFKKEYDIYKRYTCNTNKK